MMGGVSHDGVGVWLWAGFWPAPKSVISCFSLFLFFLVCS